MTPLILEEESSDDYLERLYHDNVYTCAQGVQKLAMAMLAMAVDDIFWSDKGYSWSLAFKLKREQQERDALKWVFSKSSDNDFTFWCVVAGVEADLFRDRLERKLTMRRRRRHEGISHKRKNDSSRRQAVCYI
jgi:hypothetical protein